MENTTSHSLFPNIRLHICMWCLVGCNSVIICCLTNLDMHRHLLTYLLFIVQIVINHQNLKEEIKLVFCQKAAQMPAINGHPLQFNFMFFIMLTLTVDTGSAFSPLSVNVVLWTKTGAIKSLPLLSTFTPTTALVLTVATMQVHLSEGQRLLESCFVAYSMPGCPVIILCTALC